jgi:hypothetical protein
MKWQEKRKKDWKNIFLTLLIYRTKNIYSELQGAAL